MPEPTLYYAGRGALLKRTLIGSALKKELCASQAPPYFAPQTSHPSSSKEIIENAIGPASEEDLTTLTGWRIYEARLARAPEVLSRHLNGWSVEGREGRVSSPIVELDTAARTARTGSRMYVLKGRAGTGSAADSMWAAFVRINKATDVRDITGQLFPTA